MAEAEVPSAAEAEAEASDKRLFISFFFYDIIFYIGAILLKWIKDGNSYKLCYNVSKSILDEAIKMAGLKKFFTNFTVIDDRKAVEVKLFDEYLIYACMLGVADKNYN